MDATKDRIAIVTGAARGIGNAVAHKLSEDGITVVLVDVNEDGLREAAAAICCQGREAIAVTIDVRCSKMIDKMVSELIPKLGRIDILVNNAGILQDACIEKISDEDWDNLININLRGAFYCCRAIIPQMIKQRFGRIVNVSSAGGRNGFPLAGVHYSASKAGLLGLTRQLAKQVSQYGITVNAVAPGTTETELLKGRTPKEKERLAKLIPMGRLGDPWEIATVVSFLVSDKAKYITGATIDVNGGLYMG